MSAPLRTETAHLDAVVDPARESLRDVVLGGLRGSPKTLPPKLFYDAAGAKLFERICELPEYYLTRAELAILSSRAGEIASLAGPRCALIEYGSGAGQKIRLLLDALDAPTAYLPVDISGDQLLRVAADLSTDYPRVDVRPIAADYTARVQLPAIANAARKVAFFPGSSIGNFHPAEAAAFLHRVRQTIGSNGALVLGIDRRKSVEMLHAAYDDAQGVTAAFNLNLLTRINRELGGTFDPRTFRHRAFFNDAMSRVEMHLESLATQTVDVGGETFHFDRGETIWTECSYKYDEPRLEALVRAAGFRIERRWTDGQDRFWVAFLTVSSCVD